MLLGRLQRQGRVVIRHYFCTSKPTPPPTPPPIKPQKPYANKREFKQDLKKFYHIIKPEYKRYLYNCVLTLVSSGIFMYLPNAFTDIQHLLTLNINDIKTPEILNKYGLTTLKWLAIFGTSILVSYQRRFFFMDISNRIGVRLRYIFYKNLLKSDLYRNKEHSETYSYKMITAIKGISDFMGENSFFLIRGVCFTIGGLACFFYTEPIMALISIVGVVGFSLFMRRYNLKVKELKQLEIKALNNLAEVFSERVSNAKLIKLSNSKEYEHIRFLRELKELYTKATNTAKTSGLTVGLMQGMGLTFLFLISIGGAALISFNYSTFSLLKSSTYALYVGMGVRSISNFAIDYAKISAEIKNLESTFNELYKDPEYQSQFPPDNILKKSAQLTQLQQQNSDKFVLPQQFTIQLNNIEFYYTDKARTQSPINWVIKSGKFIAFTGPSGVGKSTLLHILTSLYIPHKGYIMINEEPFPQNQLFLQRNVSYITQDSMVFSDSFRFNLCYGNQSFDTSEENLIRCLKMAEAYNFVASKGGLDAVIKQNASDLSGGEKQKIAIARALVKQPRILIMDEATSNVDYYSEQKIFRNIKEQLPKSLVIIVNHKMDLIEEFIDETVDFLDLSQPKH